MKKILINDISLDAVVRELPSRNAVVTEKPVEKGSDISDHMQTEPYTLEISGVMTEDAAYKLQMLRNLQDDAELVTYTGRNIFTNMVLQSLSTSHDTNTAEGYRYSFTLREVEITQPETFLIKVKNPETKKQDSKTATKVKKKTNVGRVQTRQKKPHKENLNKKRNTSPRAIKDELISITSPPSLWDSILKSRTYSGGTR